MWGERAGRWLVRAAHCDQDNAEVDLVREFGELLVCSPIMLLDQLSIEPDFPNIHAFLEIGATETIVHHVLGKAGGGYIVSKGADKRFIATFFVPDHVPETHFHASRASLALAGAMLRGAFDICTRHKVSFSFPLHLVKDSTITPPF
jgi:hypothetical protein